MSCQGFLSINGRLGDDAQVVGDNAPADPALHAVIAVVATAVQLVPTFQPTDPSFDAGPPITTTLKPLLPRVRLARGGLPPGLGQHDTTYATLFGGLLIRWGCNFAIGHQQVWRASEPADVMVQAGHQLGRIVRIAGQDRIATDDPTLDLVQPDHPPELGRLAQLALANDRGVRLEDADQLLGRREGFAFEHPPCGLVDHLPHAWNE